MDLEVAKQILDEVIAQSESQQQVIITQEKAPTTSHNSMKKVVADFIDTLSDKTKMDEMVDELSNDSIKLMRTLS